MILSGYLSLLTSPALSSTIPSLTSLPATIPSPTACCPDTSNYFLCLLLSEIPLRLVLAPPEQAFSGKSASYLYLLGRIRCCVYIFMACGMPCQGLYLSVTYSSVCLTVSSGRAGTLSSLCQHRAPWCLLVCESAPVSFHWRWRNSDIVGLTPGYSVSWSHKWVCWLGMLIVEEGKIAGERSDTNKRGRKERKPFKAEFL